MQSMTGFGSSRFRSEKIQLEINIKSVNSRFLDTRIHLPKEYASIEIEIKKQIAKLFRRGTVDVYINRKRGEAFDDFEIVTRKALAKKWMSSYRELQKTLRIPLEVDIETIASLPDVMQIQEKTKVSSEEKKTLLELIGKALGACQTERKREGLALKKELTRLLTELKKYPKQMEGYYKTFQKQSEEKFKQRLKNNKLAPSIEPQRIAQEVAILMDKSDIREEISRFEEHISAIQKMVNSTQCEGKKLDFYAQELLREVNTIGSKSQMAKLTSHVVQAKAVVEKIREQVQNVE